MPAYYRASINKFIETPDDQILGVLNRGSASEFYSTIGLQNEVWQTDIQFLKSEFFKIQQEHPKVQNWTILLEYPIPRRGKRLDVVLLIESMIIVIELKTSNTGKSAQLQLEDYCLDLRDFHAESAKKVLIPLLVSAQTHSSPLPKAITLEEVQPVTIVKKSDLSIYLLTLSNLCSQYHKTPIDPVKWDQSEYKPTPTIIDAAKTLYSGQNVREICRCHAGAENLTTTTQTALNVIRQAQDNKEKVICFITGVPGSGKTLAGLNIVHNHKLHDGELGSFLSGNGPLVKVLIEALTRDHVARNKGKISKQNAKRKISTFIQGVHRFRDEYFFKKDVPPADHIVIFDEAQRAWDAEHLNRWLRRKRASDTDICSEPELMLEIMDRHDWAVIVALIGGGQEINRGEAGLSEWGRALAARFSHWKICISPFLKTGNHSTGGQTLFERIPSHISLYEDASLHLNVSIRAYRAEKVSDFVHELLKLNTQKAHFLLTNSLSDYPIYLTRSLEKAKEWLKQKQRGTRRIGVTGSSGARRLKAYGLDVKNSLQSSEDVPNWFLNSIDDVRSSNALEDIATEFAVQGLELDWSCICWGADFRYTFHD